MNRRDWLATAAAVSGGAAVWGYQRRQHPPDLRPARSRVAVLHANRYSDRLDELIFEGIRLFDLDLRGKAVLLKPNLVEAIPGKPVNTDPQLIGSAAEAFLKLGASSVTVGEGPGHHRDTYLVVHETGLADQLRQRRIPFVDLNRDELIKTTLRTNYSGLGELWLPRTVLVSDFIVSMPKVKTHHWTGVTLSMKNMFGIVPGSRYGWPKNVLHWAGIHESILDICATVRPQFVIADGIVAMEGDGPLNGSPMDLRTILLADDPVAADAALSALLGLSPARIRYITEAGRFMGNLKGGRISYLT
jgi:uncharacterized protein (DUF362 family)